MKQAIILLILICCVSISACQPLAPQKPQPTSQPAASSSSDASSVATPIAAASASSSSSEQVIFVDESTCMDICHISDPNEHVADGAKPQPANHQGRTTCLACHATLDKPALPATHVGRMDAACAECHKPSSVK